MKQPLTGLGVALELCTRHFSALKQLRAAQDEVERALFAKPDKENAVIKKAWGANVLEFPPSTADFEPFVRQVRFFGPLLFFSLDGPNRLLWWWLGRWMEALRGDKAAWLDCATIARALKPWKPGPEEMTLVENLAIIVNCHKWRRICKGLNTAFKILWKQDEYQSSGPYREKQRGKLVEAYKIPIADVEAIESSLGGPPPISKKCTPTQAMYHMVAREHFVGEKTVASIWEKYVRDHPERGEKKKSNTTKKLGRRSSAPNVREHSTPPG